MTSPIWEAGIPPVFEALMVDFARGLASGTATRDEVRAICLAMFIDHQGCALGLMAMTGAFVESFPPEQRAEVVYEEDSAAQLGPDDPGVLAMRLVQAGMRGDGVGVGVLVETVMDGGRKLIAGVASCLVSYLFDRYKIGCGKCESCRRNRGELS